MTGEPDYALWWIQTDDRRKTLLSELEKVDRLLEVLTPLAEEHGGLSSVRVDGPDALRPNALVSSVAAFTPPPTPGPLAAPENAAEKSQHGTDGPGGIYSKMSSLQAATHYLTTAGGTRTTPEIADALRAGGFPSSSPNFKVNMYTTMKRLAERGAVVQLGDGKWRLRHPDEISGEPVNADAEPDQADLIE
jgi:hypothetical protein